MRLCVAFSGYQRTPFHALRILDNILGNEANNNTYVGTHYDIYEQSVLSNHLFLLNSDVINPPKKSGIPMENPELYLYAGTSSDSSYWTVKMPSIHGRLRDHGRYEDITIKAFDNGSYYLMNNVNTDIVDARERLLCDAYSSMVGMCIGEVYDSRPIIMDDWHVRLLAVENGVRLRVLCEEMLRYNGSQTYII